MTEDYIVQPLSALQRRFKSYPWLQACLGSSWLADEYKKPYEDWSLITGWLNVYELWCRDWLDGLENILNLLSTLSADDFEVIVKKVSAHCNRTQFRSVLAEFSLIAALREIGCQLKFEQQLMADSDRDVDISVTLPDGITVFHLEVYQLNPSESFIESLEVSDDGEPIPIDFPSEIRRICSKIWHKSKKFTEEDITILAIDCTLFPEMGTGYLNPVDKAMRGAYNLILTDVSAILSRVPGGLWKRGEMQRKLNGALTFQMEPETLRPTDCHVTLAVKDDDNRMQRVVEFMQRMCDHVSIHEL